MARFFRCRIKASTLGGNILIFGPKIGPSFGPSVKLKRAHAQTNQLAEIMPQIWPQYWPEFFQVHCIESPQCTYSASLAWEFGAPSNDAMGARALCRQAAHIHRGRHRKNWELMWAVQSRAVTTATLWVHSINFLERNVCLKRDILTSNAFWSHQSHQESSR